MSSRICTRCKKRLDVNRFYYRPRLKIKYTSWCKSCLYEYSKKYRKFHPKILMTPEEKAASKITKAAKMKRKLQRRKYWVDKYKIVKGCQNCGFNTHPSALDFDHIDPSIKRLQPTSSLGYSLKVLFKEFRKCQILCSNCHRIKTAQNRYVH